MKASTLIKQSYWLFLVLLVPLSLLTSTPLMADEDEAPSSVGPGKAITAISEKEGFQLSEKAQRRLNLRFLTLAQSEPYRLPAQALVYSQFEVGVYRLRQGWFKFVEVEKISSPQPSSASLSIRSSELQAGDQIVIQGTGLVRVADLEAFGGHEGGHDH